MTRDELRAEVEAAITAIEAGTGFWGRVEDTVAELILAKVRRCAEIADDIEHGGYVGVVIRREFGLEGDKG